MLIEERNEQLMKIENSKIRFYNRALSQTEVTQLYDKY
jgi:hypothetical protein